MSAKGKGPPPIETKPYTVQRKYGEVRYATDPKAVRKMILDDLKEIGDMAEYYRDHASQLLVDGLRAETDMGIIELAQRGRLRVEGVCDARTGVKYSVDITDRRRVPA